MYIEGFRIKTYVCLPLQSELDIISFDRICTYLKSNGQFSGSDNSLSLSMLRFHSDKICFYIEN